MEGPGDQPLQLRSPDTRILICLVRVAGGWYSVGYNVDFLKHGDHIS